MKVASVAEMRSLDRRAMEELSIPEIILMENAGLASCFFLSQEVGIEGQKCAVLCGPGNNGGGGVGGGGWLPAHGGGGEGFFFGR